jgi:hypothetical protein
MEAEREREPELVKEPELEELTVPQAVLVELLLTVPELLKLEVTVELWLPLAQVLWLLLTVLVTLREEDLVKPLLVPLAEPEAVGATEELKLLLEL